MVPSFSADCGLNLPELRHPPWCREGTWGREKLCPCHSGARTFFFRLNQIDLFLASTCLTLGKCNPGSVCSYGQPRLTGAPGWGRPTLHVPVTPGSLPPTPATPLSATGASPSAPHWLQSAPLRRGPQASHVHTVPHPGPPAGIHGLYHLLGKEPWLVEEQTCSEILFRDTRSCLGDGKRLPF